MSNTTAPAQPPSPTESTPTPPLTPEPSAAEQDHIQKALDASETAMDAIGTMADISMWTLAILGVFIAILALWGVAQIVRQARSAAKQIANTKVDSYIRSETFVELVKDRIDRSIEARWQNEVIAKALREESREPGDASAFEEKGE